jgi:DNA-directed RNA polymerase subunit beta
MKDLMQVLRPNLYNKVGGEQVDPDSLTDDDIMALADNLRDGAYGYGSV